MMPNATATISVAIKPPLFGNLLRSRTCNG
jgi:hypothetical protein